MNLGRVIVMNLGEIILILFFVMLVLFVYQLLGACRRSREKDRR